MRRYVLIVAAAVLILILGAGAYGAERIHAERFFAVALGDANVHETVQISETEYTVSDGVVYENGSVYGGPEKLSALRLAYEEASARRDPPFSLAGTDPTALLSAIAQLQSTQLDLASIQTTPAQASLVRSSLYPLDFLTAAAKLEEARQQFLKSGTQADAATYEQEIAQTASLYQKDLSNFKSAFQEAVPADVGQYVSAHDVVSRSGVLQAIQSLSEDGADVSRKLGKQTWCFAGLVQACDPSQIALPMLPEETTPALATAQLTQTAHVRALYVGAGLSLSATTIELAQSSCLQDSPPALVGIYDGTQLLWLNDIRFIENDTQENIPYFQQLSQHGITYAPLEPFVYYECPNIGSDWGAASATREVAQLAAQMPLSAYASGQQAAALLSLERSLTSSLLKQQDAVAYLQIGETLAAAGSLPPEIEDRVIALSVSMRDSGADFDIFISDIAKKETANSELSREGVAVDLVPEYLFFVRNGFAPLFFADNASVNPAGDLFASNTLSPDQQPYFFYSGLPHTAAMEATLQENIAAYYQFHQPTSP